MFILALFGVLATAGLIATAHALVTDGQRRIPTEGR
tara:strand:- start:39949 stop:40056 length:108 start_codon:yes stop_codon:yes gene_type:complete